MARRTPFQFDITAVNRTGPAWRGVENSIQRTQGAAQALQRTIGLLAGAAGIGLSVRAFTQMTSRALQTAEALSDLSERAGVSVEFLQGMRLAADQNGASADQFDDSISRLNRRLGMFINTGAGPAATAFRQLGLDTRIASGELDNAEKVFNAFVIELQKIENVAQQSALASQLFGDRAGPQLVGMLRRGTDGLQAYQDALRETGRLMGNDVARQGAELNARLRDIRATFDDRMANVILENAAAIEEMANQLAAVAEWGVRAASGLSGFMQQFQRQGQLEGSLEQRQALRGAAIDLRQTMGRGDRADLDMASPLARALREGLGSSQAATLIREIQRDHGTGFANLKLAGDSLSQVADQLDAMARAMMAPPGTRGPRAPTLTPPPPPPGSTGSTADPRALAPITDTIFVGQRTVDQFQSQIARHFGDGDLMPAIDAIGEVAEETATRMDTLRESYDRFNLTLEDVALNGIAAVEDALVDLIMGAEGGFRDLARSVVAMLVRMAVQQTISGMLGSISLPFGGGRASGGPVRPGMSYRVGERGQPELFTPSVPGEITPIDPSGGMGGGKLHIVIEAAEGREFNARVKSIAAELAPDIIEVSVARASSEIGADLASMSDRRLR